MSAKIVAFFKSRWTIGIIALVLVAAAVTTTVVIFTSDDGMTVRALAGNDVERRSPREYQHSRLYLHSTGTFTVRIVHQAPEEEPEVVFLGIGTYTRSGRVYTFRYLDVRMQGCTTEQNQMLLDSQENQDGFRYNRLRNGQIEFRLPPNLQIFYFR